MNNLRFNVHSELLDKLRADCLYSSDEKDNLMYEAAGYIEKLEIEIAKLRVAIREAGGDDWGGLGAK